MSHGSYKCTVCGQRHSSDDTDVWCSLARYRQRQLSLWNSLSTHQRRVFLLAARGHHIDSETVVRKTDKGRVIRAGKVAVGRLGGLKLLQGPHGGYLSHEGCSLLKEIVR